MNYFVRACRAIFGQFWFHVRIKDIWMACYLGLLLAVLPASRPSKPLGNVYSRLGKCVSRDGKYETIKIQTSDKAKQHNGATRRILLRLYGLQGLSGESSFLRWALSFLTRFFLADVVSMYLLLIRYVRVTLS